MRGCPNEVPHDDDVLLRILFLCISTKVIVITSTHLLGYPWSRLRYIS